jgi:hypothetical protein
VTPHAFDTPDQIDEFAPAIAWHLDEFSKGGEATPQDFIEMIRNTEIQLWYVMEQGKVVCALLSKINANRLKTCEITHCAGEDYGNWVGLWSILEAWAKDIGCKRIKAITRPGWERPLKSFHLKKTHVVLEKEL